MKRFLLLLTALLTVAPVWADCVLRQSDAAELTLGPYVDATDGATAETALTISQGDVILKKCAAAGDCGASAQKNDTSACAHDANGMYECDLNTTDTDTVGILEIWSFESGALPVFKTCQVVEEAVYDACCASGATVQSYPTNFASLAITAGGATTVGTNSDKTGYSIATGGINGGSFADNALTAAAAASDFGAEIGAAVTAAQGALTGTCDSGSTTTCVDNALTQADATQLQGRLICFDDSWCALITTFTPGSDTVTTTKTAPSTRSAKAYTIFPATLE